jgi:hypothetical protein
MTLDIMDLVLEDMALHANLDNEICGLKHSQKDPNRNHPAVDYLCHMMGITSKDGEEIADTELRIPICQECVDALIGNEWILFYCVYCGESQWLLKRLARNGYPEDTKIIAFKACPKCYSKQLI